MTERQRQFLCVAALAAVSLTISIGCEERVVGREGLGSERTHPTRYEKHGDDSLKDLVDPPDDP